MGQQGASNLITVPLDELRVSLDDLDSEQAPERPSDGPTDFLVNAMVGVPKNIIGGVKSGADALYSVGKVMSGVPTGNVDRVREGMGELKGVLDAQNAVKASADQAWAAGDKTTAIRKYADWLMPFIGPQFDAMADKAANGQPWGAAGDATAFGLSAVLPDALAASRIKAPSLRPAVRPSANPATADAVAFGRANDIPLNAGVVTDSPFVANVQKRLEGTLGSAAVINKFDEAKNAGLTRTGRAMADQVSPTPATPESAGAALRGETEAKVSSLKRDADVAYDRLRQIEQANPTAMTVDLKQAKADLKPLYDEFMRQAEIGVPMQGGKGKVLAALDGLMRGPDAAAASTVDQVLSDLKDLARTDSMPELRTKGQGAAAAVIPKLEAQLQAAVARGGSGAMRALTEGRAAFRQKVQVGEVLDTLKAEPVGTYKSATARQDTQIQKLRDLQRVAPNSIPTVARAWLDDAMSTATEAGKFDHADRLYANWQNLGDATKQMLYGPQMTKNLDDFFLLAKKLNENRNPSGTANVLSLNTAQVLAFLPAKAMAKVLYSPTGIKLLTEGLKLSGRPGAQAAVRSLLGQAARAAGVSNLDGALVASRAGQSGQPEESRE